MTVLQELNEIIEILEAEIPANQESPKNKTLRRRMERMLAKYFNDMGNAFPYGKLAGIYNRNVKESLGSDTRGILDPLLAAFDKKIEAEVSGQLAEVYVSGQAEMVTWGKTKGGIPIAYEGPPISQAVDFAKKRGAQLVTQMDTTTKERLARVISDGIQNKRGIPGLSKEIRNTFTDMSKYRSQLIARTETANALSTASLDNMVDMGIDGKEWVTAGDSDVSDECLANEAQGVIPVNDSFTSGVMAPPQHPNCRCTVAPAKLKK